MSDEATLLVRGERFGGWMELRVTRGLERLAADFQLAVASRWPGQEDAWPVRAFDACELRLGEDPVITGYVDDVQAQLDDETMTIRVAGRSRTADLIDCCCTIEGGEFRDSSFAAICRAVGAPHGIGVQDPQGAGATLVRAEAADQTETGFAFLERLSREAGCLLSDDPAGDLVIARLAGARASGGLALGRNVLAAAVTVRVDKRFSEYRVKGQSPAAPAWYSELDSGGQEAARPGTRARPDLAGTITDPAVPRFRPFVMQGEGGGGVRARALWQARRDAAESVDVKITVEGWRQPDGRLWAVNELVPVSLPTLDLEEELLVATVSHSLTLRDGRRTILTLRPPEAFTPEPQAPRGGGEGGGGARAWYQELRPASGR